MNSTTNIELIGNGVGAVIALLIAIAVHRDARKRGLEPRAALGWSIGTFLLLIVFLPLYLWKRREFSASPGEIKTPQTPSAPLAGVPCRYCGYENAGNSDYCGKCGRQMRSSTEIHK